MDAITPLMRVVLNTLDTCERGTGDTELGAAVYRTCGSFYDPFELLQALLALLDLGLIEARFNEFPFDAAISADPIIYEITEAGCAARWALLKAETEARSRLRDYDASIPMRDGDVLPRLGAPAVHFESRAAMRQYLSGAAA